MPTITIEGPRCQLAVKRRLAEELTPLVADAYGWDPGQVVVIIRENPDTNVAQGGVLRLDRDENEREGRRMGHTFSEAELCRVRPETQLAGQPGET